VVAGLFGCLQLFGSSIKFSWSPYFELPSRTSTTRPSPPWAYINTRGECLFCHTRNDPSTVSKFL